MVSRPRRSYCAPVVTRRLLNMYGDQALAVAIGLLYCVELSFEGDVEHRLPSIAVAVFFAVALAFRRRAPVAALAVGLCVIELDNTVLKGLAEAGAFLLGFVIALYSAGRHARGRWAIVSVVIVIAAIPFAAIEPGSPVGFSDFAFFTMFFAGPFVVGRVIRYRREREHHLEQEAKVAVVDERVRIARELHDVVAHAISVIVLQARGGRRMLDESPAETRAALDAIERAGEQALVEMRRLLGLLRDTDEAAALAPQPSLAHISELAARMSETGLPVEVRVEGAVVELPPGIDVTAYRIVQEGLTNALKHAGPAHARVVVRYGDDMLELEVLDDGTGSANGGGSGHGLAGIKERVAVYGGDLESGRRPEGGFSLKARLPLAGIT
jgi:signal transduction histidine kinase